MLLVLIFGVSTKLIAAESGIDSESYIQEQRIKLAKSLQEQKINLTDKGIKKELESMTSSKTKENQSTSLVQQDRFVVMNTSKGNFKIKLFMKQAPITASNFLDLAQRKFYDGIIFHRIIPGFVVQGGCPKGDGTGAFIDPETHKERRIKHEITNFKHDKAGMLAMARTSDPDSASSQFFIDLAPLPSLDPGGVDPYGYTIFGQVVEGMDIVEKIVKENIPPYPGSDSTTNPVKILSTTVLD